MANIVDIVPPSREQIDLLIESSRYLLVDFQKIDAKGKELHFIVAFEVFISLSKRDVC